LIAKTSIAGSAGFFIRKCTLSLIEQKLTNQSKKVVNSVDLVYKFGT
jgi:hypothetical protein